MEKRYLFETFSSDSGSFDGEFTNFLNSKKMERWEVKECSYCHDTLGRKMYASCLFRRSS
jgi:hypothetical protein